MAPLLLLLLAVLNPNFSTVYAYAPPRKSVRSQAVKNGDGSALLPRARFLRSMGPAFGFGAASLLAPDAIAAQSPPKSEFATGFDSQLQRAKKEVKKMDKTINREKKRAERTIGKETKKAKQEVKKLDKKIGKETKKIDKKIGKETRKIERIVDRETEKVGRKVEKISGAVEKRAGALVGGGAVPSATGGGAGIDVSRLKVCDGGGRSCVR